MRVLLIDISENRVDQWTTVKDDLKKIIEGFTGTCSTHKNEQEFT